jgi:hypothetical protein
MCSNYALTNLSFGLCRSMWIIDLLINLSSPHLGAPARPSTLEVLRAKECAPTPFPFDVFIFRLIVESIKELEGASIVVYCLSLVDQVFNINVMDICTSFLKHMLATWFTSKKNCIILFLNFLPYPCSFPHLSLYLYLEITFMCLNKLL